jgi:transcriptional regulator with XRE-family HTH domain
MEYGKNFIKARNRKGMDQKDAAAALEVSPSFLYKIERDKKKPSLDLIEKAAALYGVGKAFFFHEQTEIDINELYTNTNLGFIEDLNEMTIDEIHDKYSLKFDGKELSKDELKGVIAFVRSMRSIDK